LTSWRGGAIFINVDAGFATKFSANREKSSLCEEENKCGEEQIVQKYGLTPLTWSKGWGPPVKQDFDCHQLSMHILRLNDPCRFSYASPANG
jgi:hypothetical protein